MNVYWEIAVVLLAVVVCVIAIKLWRVNDHFSCREMATIGEIDKLKKDVSGQDIMQQSLSRRLLSVENHLKEKDSPENKLSEAVFRSTVRNIGEKVAKLEKLANMTSVTIDPGKLKVLKQAPGGVIPEENKQAPVIHRFYPCHVTHRADSEDFCWNYFSKSKAYFMQGGRVPEGFKEKPCNVSIDCTVEILEYPDGTYSAAWFPGEFREEEA